MNLNTSVADTQQAIEVFDHADPIEGTRKPVKNVNRSVAGVPDIHQTTEEFDQANYVNVLEDIVESSHSSIGDIGYSLKIAQDIACIGSVHRNVNINDEFSQSLAKTNESSNPSEKSPKYFALDEIFDDPFNIAKQSCEVVTDTEKEHQGHSKDILGDKSHFEGTFSIPFSDWLKIEPSPNNYDFKLLIHVIKIVAKCIFDTCVVNFSSHRVNVKQSKSKKKLLPKVVYYGKCAHKDCKSYIFKIYHNLCSVSMDVFSTGTFKHESQPKSSQLRGCERFLVQEDLVKTQPKSYRMKCIAEQDEQMILSGNLGVIRSLDVIEKARSEKAQRGDKHKDDFIDLYLLFKEDKKLNKKDSFFP